MLFGIKQISLPGQKHNCIEASNLFSLNSRKHLRYEAAELVRSLQSSRTSLERAGLGGSSNPGSYTSGGTLGRRLGRPYSPALRERRELLVSPGARLEGQGWPQGGSRVEGHGWPQGGPRVESPLSPHNSSAPASLSQGVTRAFQGLHLEEGNRWAQQSKPFSK